jgi:hypothetical protein
MDGIISVDAHCGHCLTPGVCNVEVMVRRKNKAQMLIWAFTPPKLNKNEANFGFDCVPICYGNCHLGEKAIIHG